MANVYKPAITVGLLCVRRNALTRDCKFVRPLISVDAKPWLSTPDLPSKCSK